MPPFYFAAVTLFDMTSASGMSSHHSFAKDVGM
jgi:hypothetical protein